MQPLDRISGYAHVAARYGLEESIFLDSIMFWWKENRANERNYRDGHWWTYNSVRAFADLMPWWSAKQIRRIIDSCLKQGAILDGEYNTDRRDRTVWYTPSDELLALYGVQLQEEPEENADHSICPNGQMHLTKRASASAQTGKPLPCINHVYNNPPIVPPEGGGEPEPQKPKKRRKRDWKETAEWKPDRFEAFWQAYPKGKDRQSAIYAWDKLQPSDELIHTMAKALKRDMRGEDWQKGIGIPYAATWLNGRRWEDEDRPPVTMPSDGGPGQPLRGEGVTYL